MNRAALVAASIFLAASLASSQARADEAEATAQASVTTTTPAQPRERASLLVPAIVTGVGVATVVAGITLVATAPAMPASCDPDTRTCTRQPGQDDASFREDQDRAGRAHLMPIAGKLTAGLGGMIISAGVLTWLFDRFDREGRLATSSTPASTAAGTRRALSATPYAGLGGCGIVGTF